MGSDIAFQNGCIQAKNTTVLKSMNSNRSFDNGRDASSSQVVPHCGRVLEMTKSAIDEQRDMNIQAYQSLDNIVDVLIMEP